MGEDDTRIQRALDRIYNRLDNIQNTADTNAVAVASMSVSITGSEKTTGIREDVRWIRRQQEAMNEKNGRQDKKIDEHERKLSNQRTAIIIAYVLLTIIIVGGVVYVFVSS